MQFNMIDVTSDQYKQDQQRLQTLRTQIVIWLIVIALCVALIPLMLITSWVRTDVARLEAELLSLQNAVSSATSPSAEVMLIGTEISGIEQLISTMQTVTIPSGVQWPVVVDAVRQFDATTIEITSFTQTPDKIQLAGRATSNDAVVRYQQQLLDARAFKDVVVISMSTIPPTPTPAVTGKEEASAEEAATAPVEDDLPLGNVEFVIDVIVADGNAITAGVSSTGSATP
jgi:hypothetical protein